MKLDLVVTEPRQTGVTFLGTSGKRYLIVMLKEKSVRFVPYTYRFFISKVTQINKRDIRVMLCELLS